MQSRLTASLPGLAVALALGLAGLSMAMLPQLARWQLSALTCAIVLGMLLGNFGPARLMSRLTLGLHFSQRHLLRAGVVLYGLRLSFQDVAAIGAPGLLLDLAIVGSTLVLGTWAGRRWFGLDRHTAKFIAGNFIARKRMNDVDSDLDKRLRSKRRDGGRR